MSKPQMSMDSCKWSVLQEKMLNSKKTLNLPDFSTSQRIDIDSALLFFIFEGGWRVMMNRPIQSCAVWNPKTGEKHTLLIYECTEDKFQDLELPTLRISLKLWDPFMASNDCILLNIECSRLFVHTLYCFSVEKFASRASRTTPDSSNSPDPKQKQRDPAHGLGSPAA